MVIICKNFLPNPVTRKKVTAKVLLGEKVSSWIAFASLSPMSMSHLGQWFANGDSLLGNNEDDLRWSR